MRTRFSVVALLVLLSESTLAGEGAIRSVAVSPPFFNPTIGQHGRIAFSVADHGALVVRVLDRDLVPIRTLPEVKDARGDSVLEWDGRDDTGQIVPNEAYTLDIVCDCSSGRVRYAPGVGFHGAMSEPTRTYSMASGVLTYELPQASRVHIQAGQAVLGKDGKRSGPVLRTVVDREPRASGAIAEQFDGFDASGTVFIPSLRDAVTSIMTETLAPNVIITVGNRAETFAQYATFRRRGVAVAGAESDHHEPGPHHQGLTSLEDRSPGLKLSVTGRDSAGRVRSSGDAFRVRVEMSEDDAARFVRPEAELMVFIDEKEVLRKKGLKSPADVKLDVRALSDGEHRLVANWSSGHGPVGVQVLKFSIDGGSKSTLAVPR